MSKRRIKAAFQLKPIMLPLDLLVETRPLKEANLRQSAYAAVKSSIEQVGLVQPLVVCPAKDRSGKYKILDGHMRFYALRDLGHKEALCIISTDDERYTFDAQVNQINPIQRHKMILQAIKNGVSSERIAAALNVDPKRIASEMNMLKGIHPEAVEILKDKPIRANALQVMRRVNAIRQIEMAENMCAVNNFSHNYAQALFAATRPDQMANGRKPKKISGVSPETIARMEKEMETLDNDYERIKAGYSKNVYALTVIQGYIKRLLSNDRVRRYINKHRPEMLPELESISEMESLSP